MVILTHLINLLFRTSISDAAGATKIFRKDIYDNLKVETNGFDFEFELICKYAKKKCNIYEFPIQYFPRTFEQGKKIHAVKDGLKILRVILKSYLINK